MRARNLKPSIHKNEDLARLGCDHYKLFTGLLGLADRKGRLEDRPERIEAEIFPFKFQQVDVNKMLNELAGCSEKFILRYEKGGQRYIQVVNFLKHNYPHIREAESTIPAPDKHHASTMKDRPLPSSLFPLPSSLNPITSGGAQKSKRFIPPSAEEARAYAQSIGFKLDGEAFCAHYEARGWKYGPGRPMVSWQAAVVTWKKKAEPSALIQPPRAIRLPEVLPKPEELVSGEDLKGLRESLKTRGIPRA